MGAVGGPKESNNSNLYNLIRIALSLKSGTADPATIRINKEEDIDKNCWALEDKKVEQNLKTIKQNIGAGGVLRK